MLNSNTDSNPVREIHMDLLPGGVGHAIILSESTPSAHVMPNGFIAAIIGSEKNTGSTRSTMSPETSRKFLLFSNGISALRAPLSIATCNGSARDSIGLMFPWMLRSPR
jgi:hypothetical protein